MKDRMRLLVAISSLLVFCLVFFGYFLLIRLPELQKQDEAVKKYLLTRFPETKAIVVEWGWAEITFEECVLEVNVDYLGDYWFIVKEMYFTKNNGEVQVAVRIRGTTVGDAFSAGFN